MKNRHILIAAALLAIAAFAQSAQALDYTCDVAVVGGGCGGFAAALQAARLGAKVMVIEPTEMLGGQMTSAAVSTMDDRGTTRTGIYKEFIDKVKRFYSKRKHGVSTCYWGGDTIAFEPCRGVAILNKMLKNAGVEVIYNAETQSAKTKKNSVTSATFKTPDGAFSVHAKVFIDATECGDFIARTPAAFRAGASVSPHIDTEGMIQDITYVAVVKKYPEGVPANLQVNTAPTNYARHLKEFRSVVTKNGNNWPEGYPYNPVTHNEYRGLPNLESPLLVDGGIPATWKNVTKTCINWANDYPGMTYSDKKENMSVRYLTNKHFRREAMLRAMEKTLAFIYYMQHELGMSDWSVSDEGYTRQLADWQQDITLAPYAEILKHFPCQPYVRESRRVVGVKTVTVKDVLRDPVLLRTLHSIPDAIALGEYPVDLHGIIEDKYLEADLGETKDVVPNDWQTTKSGLFQLPLGALIPEKTDGLLAAEKNISVSRVVNGATRLQPVTMLTGQAAGTLAALAVKQKIRPREVKVTDVQKELLSAGDKLFIQTFDDVSSTDKNWKYIEFALVHDCLVPNSETVFGVRDTITFLELRNCFEKLTGIRNKKLDLDPFMEMSCAAAAQWLKQLADGDEKYKKIIEGLEANGAKPLTKTDVAKIAWQLT